LPLSTAAKVIRFGSFEVDLRSGELRRNGLAVRLQGQPFQILAMLLEHPGELIPREDIRRRLWPADTFVDFEHSLNAAIKRLREALGESAEKPVFIETLPRRGYRIRIPVHSISLGAGISESHSVRPRAWSRQAAYLVGGLALFIVSYMGLRLRHGRALSVQTIQASTSPMRVVPFTTTPGAELEPTFSPDGKAIAFLWDQGALDKTDLYVKLIGAEQPLRITYREGGICNAAWSPDGRYIASGK
jgi:DNA-binding winged helix-turn-helix (wHTH) protein